MKVRKLIIVVILMIACIKQIKSDKILGVFTSHSKSHLIIYMSVVNALVEKGHDVTVVTTLPLNDKVQKYRHIKLPSEDFREKMKNFTQSDVGKIGQVFQFFSTIDLFLKKSADVIKSDKMQELMKQESFDLLILGYFFNDFQIGLATHFNCPVVMIWTGQPFNFINYLVGNPSEISHVPNIFLNASKNLNFIERIKNFIIWLIEQAAIPLLHSVMNKYYEEMFPPNRYPSFNKALSNLSLVLCNHHFSEGPIRANVPAIVEIGGIQIKPKPDPLPLNLKQFLDEAKENGVIYFSLGSNVHSADLKPELIQIIYEVLSNLKQKVIWKWETSETPGKSSNILYSKWVPQDDILAHPNTRLFITHGGKGSVVEAKYHGVPMIGLPFFADQFINVNIIESEGFGKGLEHRTITADTLKSTIKEILENPKYKENIQKYSALYRDRPMTARETATYWIEYVIRHRGAAHLQSPVMHMKTVAYMGLDVVGFLLLAIYLFYKISKFFMKLIWRKLNCWKLKNNKKEKTL